MYAQGVWPKSRNRKGFIDFNFLDSDVIKCVFTFAVEIFRFSFIPNTEINYDSWILMNFSHWTWFMLYSATIFNLFDTIDFIKINYELSFCYSTRFVYLYFFWDEMLVIVLCYFFSRESQKANLR